MSTIFKEAFSPDTFKAQYPDQVPKQFKKVTPDSYDLYDEVCGRTEIFGEIINRSLFVPRHGRCVSVDTLCEVVQFMYGLIARRYHREEINTRFTWHQSVLIDDDGQPFEVAGQTECRTPEGYVIGYVMAMNKSLYVSTSVFRSSNTAGEELSNNFTSMEDAKRYVIGRFEEVTLPYLQTLEALITLNTQQEAQS